MDHEERHNFTKMDLTYQVNHFHKIKIGIDWVQYELFKVSVLKHQITFGDVDYYRFFVHNIEYKYSPNRGSIYIQDKIDYDGLIANIGLRYDYFDPQAYRPALEERQLSDSTIYQTTWIINYNDIQRASIKHQISPRVGIALPISDDSEFRINYGYFFQLPQFDYLYTNADYTVVQGFTPIGDPDLEPAKTIAIEVGFKKSFNEKYLLDVTIFQKDVSNLIDVNTYIHQGHYLEEISGISGLTQYLNVAKSYSMGMELLFKFIPTEKLNGYLSYTYMHAEGTASSDVQQFETLQQQYNLPNKAISYDLSWDQRHTIIGNIEYTMPYSSRINLIYRYNSPLPYTKDRGIITVPNNARLNATSSTDIVLDKVFSVRSTEIKLYVQTMNLFNTRNILWKDRHSIIGGSLSDPSAYDQQRRVTLGVNIAY